MSEQQPEDAGTAPVGPIVPPGDDKDLTMIAPPKAAKAKKPAKGKGAKGKGAKGKGAKRGGASIASHPRARAQIRRAKGWGGLAGFATAAYLSYQAQVPFVQLELRAIVAGIAGYLVAWAFMVTVWRYVLLAELNALAERQRAAAASAAAAASIPASAARPPGGGE